MDPLPYPEGSYEIGSVCPSILPSVRCFLGVGPLGFSKFWNGTRNPCQVVHDTAGFFGKTFFVPQNWGNGSKIGFFEFKIKFGH